MRALTIRPSQDSSSREYRLAHELCLLRRRRCPALSRLKLGEISVRFPITRIELDRRAQTRSALLLPALPPSKIRSDPPSRRKSAPARGDTGHYPRERHSFFAGGDSGVPIVEIEISAAQQVEALSGWSAVDLFFESLQGLVNLACGEKVLRRVGDGGKCKKA